MPATVPIWASQPFKALYVTFFLFKLPFNLIYYICKFNLSKHLRPNKELSAKDNVGTAVFKSIFQALAATRTPSLMVPEPTAAGERCVDVKIPSPSLLTGVLASSDAVKPAPLHAVWFPSPPSRDAAAANSQKTLLHFPGGAFVIKFNYANFAPLIAAAARKNLNVGRTIWAQYRLAGSPETSFPAAVQDALAFYAYVLSTNIDPKNVMLSGDSAGGNVALALLRYLEESKVLPLPGSCMAFSPWVHVSDHAAIDYNASRNADGDVLGADFLQWGADAYRPGLVSKEVEPYISPLHHPFKTSVPLFLHVGGAEAFCADVEEFASQMWQVNGSDKTLLAVTPHVTHDILVIPGHQGKTEELYKSLRDANAMFDRS